MYVLLHSPLIGPFTWSPVVTELQTRRARVLVPRLQDDPSSAAPYWQQHADRVARAIKLNAESVREEIVLVGHSGAGPLLPAVRAALGHAVSHYLFVDAGIPRDRATRLTLLAEEDEVTANELRAYLENGGRFPNWTDETLSEILPAVETRAAVLRELKPRGLDFFVERIPVFAGFPDAPCAYLQFSPAYDHWAHIARSRGWRYQRMDGGHFHMLVEPQAVTDALLLLVSP